MHTPLVSSAVLARAFACMFLASLICAAPVPCSTPSPLPTPRASTQTIGPVNRFLPTPSQVIVIPPGTPLISIPPIGLGIGGISIGLREVSGSAAASSAAASPSTSAETATASQIASVGTESVSPTPTVAAASSETPAVASTPTETVVAPDTTAQSASSAPTVAVASNGTVVNLNVVVPVAQTGGDDQIPASQLNVNVVLAPGPSVAAPSAAPTLATVEATNGNDSIAAFSNGGASAA
ncbi:hypothetical protein HKX48_008149 [Thoreauomyces humboldtii]|nr:hypothetical protein HKX48_008149 [Thoreauomyces humboldtii]